MASNSTSSLNTPSKLVKTALAAVDAYNIFTIEAILAPRAPNCTHQVLPASLGRSPLTNDEYIANFQPMMQAFKNFHIAITETFEDQANNKVAMLASTTGETPLGAYSSEYVLMLQMTEDQEKVLQIKEFVDSANSVGFLVKLREYMAGQKAET